MTCIEEESFFHIQGFTICSLLSMKMSVTSCLMMVAVLMVTDTISFTEAQNTIPPCVLKLQPCLNYLNSTSKPPATCCNPLKEAVTNEFTCLCNLYNTPGLVKSFGLDVNSAIRLIQNCGIHATLSDCKNAAAPPPSETPPSPGVPGNDNGGASRVACTGISIALLSWASMMFY